MTMEKREKLKESFRISRVKVKDWEAKFFEQHQRKPSKEEMKTAPEQIQICYKNCWKIRSYFESEKDSCDNLSVIDESSQAMEMSNTYKPSGKENFSDNLSETEKSSHEVKVEVTKAEDSSKNSSKPSFSSIWGSHLNKKSFSQPTAVESDASLKINLSLSQDITSKTRKSLKKRTRAFQSFTETLGLPSEDSESSFVNKSLSDQISKLPTDEGLKSEFQAPSSSASKESPLSVKEDKKPTVQNDNENDDDGLELFPSLKLKHTEIDKSVASSKSVGFKHEDLSLRRKVDTNWLSRCSGIQVEKDLEVSSQLEANHVQESKENKLSTDHSGDNKPNPEKVDILTSKQLNDTNIGDSKQVIQDVELSKTVVVQSYIQESQEASVNNKEVKNRGRKSVKESNEPSNKKKRKKRDDSDYEEEEDSHEEIMDKKKVASKAKPTKRKPRKRAKVEETPEDEQVIEEPAGPSEINIYALGFEDKGVDTINVKKITTAKERLEMKVRSGKANENFVKIDLKKKSYSRGKMSGAKIKRAEWKRKLDMKEGRKVKEFKCYNCQQTGHFAWQCTGTKGDSLIPTDMAEDFDASDFPSLQEAADMASGVLRLEKSSTTVKMFSSKNEDVIMDIDSKDDDWILEAARQFEVNDEDKIKTAETKDKLRVPPLDIDTEGIHETLGKFGYSGFRPGQLETIQRIVAGKSSLALLATGTGKSLIYQLPAFLYRERGPCITLVVSPLVSLMEDQVTGLPNFLRAAALHYNMTQTQKEKVIAQVKSGALHFLLVSPESLTGGGMFSTLLPSLPPIAFVCIDEAHCVSHWSHNFRPSYLRLCKIIREKLGVNTILGLTATAPESLTRSVAGHLGVSMEDVIRGPLLPGNLTLTVSRDMERDRALVSMLADGGSLAECESVIVYCTRREECERLATFIRTHLQTRDNIPGKSKLSTTAEPYHAGLSAYKRKTVQAAFMGTRLRIVVATVAFGMGIDKSDIRAIIHYNMPRSFESYIQEIGRAGRDGKAARCHLFLDNRGEDVRELKRHIHANSVDRFTLRKFVTEVLGCEDPDVAQEYQEVALSVGRLVERLDMPEENISTLLCYLEDYSPPLVHVSNHVYCQAKVQCYGGPRQLRQIAAKSPPLAAAVAILRKQGVELEAASSVEFPVVSVSARMGWDSAIVKKELKNLEWSSTPAGWRKSGALVEFSDLAFHFSAKTGLSEARLDEVLEDLMLQAEERERSELWSLVRLGKAFSIVAVDKELECSDTDQSKVRSDKLKLFIREYFTELERQVPETMPAAELCHHEDSVRSDIRSFVCTHNDHVWTGRAVARVFHGISSPNFPAIQWGKVYRFWRKHLDVDFHLLVKLATEEIVSLRTGAR